jgi:segregation and condensation protein B
MQAVEAIVSVALEPVSMITLSSLLGASIEDVAEAVEVLMTQDLDHPRGFQLVEIAGGLQYRTRPEFEEVVRAYVAQNFSTRLSKAALETLAIVAYRQPISRAQIAAIRGVQGEGVVKMLQARGYIAPTHRDSGPGQALLYTTTPLFLERLGLASIADLPQLSHFVPSVEAIEAIEAALGYE